MSGAVAYKEAYEEYELINGQEYMMARPSVRHWRVASNIIGIFKNHLKGKRCQAFGEVDVHLSEKDNVVPDAMIVCNPDIIEDDGIHGAPDLVVEVLSASTAKRDRVEKLQLYEKYGVKEYWIVNPYGKSVDVYHLTDGKLELAEAHQYFAEEKFKWMNEEIRAAALEQKLIKVSLCEDFIVELKDVFEDVD